MKHFVIFSCNGHQATLTNPQVSGPRAAQMFQLFSGHDSVSFWIRTGHRMMLYLNQVPDLLTDKIWIKGQRIEDSTCVTDQNIVWWGEGSKADASVRRICTAGLFSSPHEGERSLFRLQCCRAARLLLLYIELVRHTRTLKPTPALLLRN